MIYLYEKKLKKKIQQNFNTTLQKRAETVTARKNLYGIFTKENMNILKNTGTPSIIFVLLSTVSLF